MSKDDQIQSNELTFEELSNDKVIDKNNIEVSSIKKSNADADLYLKLYKQELKLIEANIKNNQLNEDLLNLKTKYEKLSSKYDKTEKKKNDFSKLIKLHEQKMRKLFDLYKSDKDRIQKYEFMTQKLSAEIADLKFEIDKQQLKYNDLKNQLSYKLGNRLVNLKKPKDIIKLPKSLLNDYIKVRNKIDNPKSLVINPNQAKLLSSPYLSNKNAILFDKNTTIAMLSKFNTILFKQGFKGVVVGSLYGVRPRASIDIEIRISVHSGDCLFRIAPELKVLHHIINNESLTFNFTVHDNKNYELIDLVSCSGIVDVSIKKTRGVPSFLYLYKNELDSQVVVDNKAIKSDSLKTEILTDSITAIPKLQKKSCLLREAEEIRKNYGFETVKLFIDKYAPEGDIPTLNILYANEFLDNDEVWISYLNKYLTHYNMQTISLNDDQDNMEKFYRINSKMEYEINDEVKITVLMPVYNGEKTIRHSVCSILNQTWKNLELIIINDYSTDKTLDIINKLATKDARIKVINNPRNVGAYVSKNLGLKLATGDYITGHDADDWAYPQRLEQHMNLIRSQSPPPRASNTRMIRMEDNGYLPLYPVGPFCHDGVMRIASITCMFEVNFLKNTLGGWDCARFGADSEIINRCKMVIGDEFKNFKSLSMICLDEPTSLTNDPLHGVSKTTGISPSRRFYKEQWDTWHKSLDKQDVFLEFPHLDRKFDVPKGTEIPEENILAAIDNVNNLNESN